MHLNTSIESEKLTCALLKHVKKKSDELDIFLMKLFLKAQYAIFGAYSKYRNRLEILGA